MGQGLSITADSRLVAFNTLALQTQDEAYTLAYYMLGDERGAEKATQSAFNHLFKHGQLQAGRFRLEVLRGILASCQSRSGSLLVLPKTSAAAESRDDLSWKLLGLQENERAVVILVDVLGLNYIEAAHVLGGSKKQVCKLLAQARLKLGRNQTTIQ